MSVTRRLWVQAFLPHAKNLIKATYLRKDVVKTTHSFLQSQILKKI